MFKSLEIIEEDKIKVVIDRDRSPKLREVLNFFFVEYDVGTHTTNKEDYFIFDLEDLTKHILLYIKFNK